MSYPKLTRTPTRMSLRNLRNTEDRRTSVTNSDMSEIDQPITDEERRRRWLRRSDMPISRFGRGGLQQQLNHPENFKSIGMSEINQPIFDPERRITPSRHFVPLEPWNLTRRRGKSVGGYKRKNKRRYSRKLKR